MIRLIVGLVLLALGLFVCCVSVLGVFRFRYVLSRMHAASLADTMGLFLVTMNSTVVMPAPTAASVMAKIGRAHV